MKINLVLREESRLIFEVNGIEVDVIATEDGLSFEAKDGKTVWEWSFDF